MSSVAETRSRPAIAPPRGAAISGVIFAVLMIVGLGLVRYAIPIDLRTPGVWVSEPRHRNAVLLALKLVPFAGIAFLWFIGVLRNRLAELEDRFFATVFLGSGLLFVASLFGAAAVTDALIQSVGTAYIGSNMYYFGRRMSDMLLNIFAMKMAGVFMFSTCTIGLKTAILTRWVAFIGYACALLLLLVIADWKWITLVFPMWMLLVSMDFLLAELRWSQAGAVAAPRHHA